MTYELNKKLIESIKCCHKNPDYSLGCFVDGLDADSCSNMIEVPETIKFGDEKVPVEISDRTVSYINNIFGYCNRDLVEVLMWISAYLPEI